MSEPMPMDLAATPPGKEEARDDKIEQLQADLDRKMGRRSDCKVCGKTVPFVGAVFCSEKCWRKAEEESHAS